LASDLQQTTQQADSPIFLNILLEANFSISLYALLAPAIGRQTFLLLRVSYTITSYAPSEQQTHAPTAVIYDKRVNARENGVA